MKKYIAILILILSCQAGYSQSMDKLFNDFANQKNPRHNRPVLDENKQLVHRDDGCEKHRSPFFRGMR